MSPETKKNLSGSQELGITLGCGITAGVAAAVLSHPADVSSTLPLTLSETDNMGWQTLLSKINKGGGGPGSSLTKLRRLAVETGPAGLFSGLGPRIVMTAGLVAGQFLLYGQLKAAFGAGAGVEIHKVED